MSDPLTRRRRRLQRAFGPAALHVRTRRVASSTIARMGYDRATGRLTVRFRTGTEYQYREVPPALWWRLQRVRSKGRFLLRHIADRFPYRRVA